MNEFLNVAISFPTVVWTILLGCVFMFWIVILASGLDHDTFDIQTEVGDVGDIHTEVHADGDVDVDGDVDGHGHHVETSSILSTLLGFINIGQVPLTVVLSLLILQGWIVSMFSHSLVGTLGSNLTQIVIWGGLMLFATFLVAYAFTGLTTRPLRGVFKIHSFHAQEAVIDKVCKIRTTEVTGNLGQAEYSTGGAPLILSVRCNQKNNLKRGDEAVIISFNREKDLYEVAPLTPEKKAKV